MVNTKTYGTDCMDRLGLYEKVYSANASCSNTYIRMNEMCSYEVSAII